MPGLKDQAYGYCGWTRAITKRPGRMNLKKAAS